MVSSALAWGLHTHVNIHLHSRQGGDWQASGVNFLLHSAWKHTFTLSMCGMDQGGRQPPTFAPPDTRTWSETYCLPKHLLALPSGRKCFLEALCSLL